MHARDALLAALLSSLGCSDSSGDLTGAPSGGSSGNAPSGPDAGAGGADGGAPNDARAPGDAPSGGGDAAPTADADATAAPLGPLYAYVSGYGPDIGIFSVDPQSGQLTSKGSTASFGSAPSFLAIDRGATHLYALDENTNGRVGAYAIDKSTGALTYMNDVSSQGQGPAHVSVDATGKWVMVANYGDGNIAVIAVASDGSLGAATYTENAGANAHMIVADPSNKFVFVPCLGSDYVAEYTFDATSGKLTPNSPAHVTFPSGTGPRHLAFHPGGAFAYVMNETASSITALALGTTSGVLTPIETQSTLPQGFSGTNTGAEVWVHPSGKWVYGSNRGDDSIVAFAIDQATGKMTLLGHTKTGGATPRDFTLDPAGHLLYAANQGSGTVTSFVVGANGALSAGAASVAYPQPSFVGLVRLPAP